MKRQQGFTLVEIAIVLVIIGLILGGVLKGQELIDSARVKSLQNDMSGTVSAWFSFTDRYRALPGDYTRAQAQISGNATNGDGDATIDTANEAAGVWQHLSLAGFISGSYDGEGSAIGTVTDADGCRPETCPQNPYNSSYKVAWGKKALSPSGNTISNANEFYTGDQIPARILQQLDLKIDDGVASRGDLRYFNGHKAACVAEVGGETDWAGAGGEGDCAAVLRTP